MTTQYLWDVAKAVLSGKFIAVQSYLKKQEKTSNRQPNFTPKTTGKKNKNKNNNKNTKLLKDRNHKDPSRNK